VAVDGRSIFGQSLDAIRSMIVGPRSFKSHFPLFFIGSAHQKLQRYTRGTDLAWRD
jgi:hypothetical protein